MEEKYETFNHSKTRIRYHIIFSTKYRRKCLVGIEDRVREAFEEASRRCGFTIKNIGIDKDHVHLLIKARPSIAPTQIVRRLKQLSTKFIWQACETELRTFYKKSKTVWTHGYFCSTIGEVSEDKIFDYIENQG